MFGAIRNFLDYVKNASSNTKSGEVAPIADMEEEIASVPKVVLATAKRCPSILYSAKHNMSKVIEHKIHIEEDNLKDKNIAGRIDKMAADVGDASVVNKLPKRAQDCGYDYEDDIEMHIKPSIIKHTQNSNSELVDGNKNRSYSIRSKKSIADVPLTHNHNQNVAELPDELDDFRNDPMQPMQVKSADTESVLSEEAATDVTEATEDEDVEEPYVEPFAGSEIIVLNDAELNASTASTASDALSEDPLAIDDLAHPAVVRDSSHPIDSSTTDEASTNAEVLWVNVEEIKTNTLQPNLQKDSCESTPTSTPQRRCGEGNKHQRNKIAINGYENAEEIRSDGSDSGLGSETSTLQTTLASLSDTIETCVVDADNSSTPSNKPKLTQDKSKLQRSNAIRSTGISLLSNNDTTVTLPPAVPKPLRSNLKRRINEEGVSNSPENNDNTLVVPQQKKPKRSINFDNVQVYYFPRQQGFGCVPSAGGCTLGMGARHIGVKTLTLAEHAAELRRAHRHQSQEINLRGFSSDDSEESEEDFLSEGSGSDLDAESNGFLQPVSPKQRRALLKAAGVRKIDASEKSECRNIRNSREVCGCSCAGFCDPETCACNQVGIKCQVDRTLFPCGCTRDGCGNTVGRVEFNAHRVRTHYIHTIMRLEMENRQQLNPSSGASLVYSLSATDTATAGAQTTAGTSLPTYTLPNNFYNLQPESNYSSGYASPAYSGDQSTNYYQHQSTHYSPVNSTEIPTQSYQLDTLDTGIFTSTAPATATYSDVLPSYSGDNTTNQINPTYHNMSYAAITHTPVSSYSSYHQTSTDAYVSQLENQTPSTTFSSCAVPSLPPYGTATTTAASPQYQQSSSFTLDTTAPSCLNIDDNDADIESAAVSSTGGSSFINLSTPIASSTRISQINDLLQHNRNTTAALVAVPAKCTATNSNTLTPLNITSITSANQTDEERNDGNYTPVSQKDTVAENESNISKTWHDREEVVEANAIKPTPTESLTTKTRRSETIVADSKNKTADDSNNSVDTGKPLVVTTAVDVGST